MRHLHLQTHRAGLPQGVYRAKVTGLIDHHLGEECKFNVDEYEFYGRSRMGT